jgi:hypothetical protein
LRADCVVDAIIYGASLSCDIPPPLTWPRLGG